MAVTAVAQCPTDWHPGLVPRDARPWWKDARQLPPSMKRRGEDSLEWWARTTRSFAGWALATLAALALVIGPVLVLGDRIVLGLLMVLLGVPAGVVSWVLISRS